MRGRNKENKGHSFNVKEEIFKFYLKIPPTQVSSSSGIYVSNFYLEKLHTLNLCFCFGLNNLWKICPLAFALLGRYV
jgi:hypothetical protein